MIRRRVSIVAVIALVSASAGAAWAVASRGASVESSASASQGAPKPAFPAERVRYGASLAAIGNCAGCHTARDAVPYAGGQPLVTPFGTIYSSNITPDARTGIGEWPEAAFVRAMREGISRDGHHLYPAFPYDHFTHSTDDDLSALFAFLMTRTPVAAVAPPNDLRFPFGFRPLVAEWNLLYLDRTPVRPDPTRSQEWNRGAYLTEALAHCSACHSPRNALGAEKRDSPFAGGEAEGWYSPPLNVDSPSPQPWSVSQLTEYLRTGITADHAIAGGPMKGVTESLSHADEADVRAIAVYVASLMEASAASHPERQEASRRRAAQPLAGRLPASADSQQVLGATVYATACASCHDLGRGASSGSGLRMPLAVAVYDADPRSLIRIVREGIVPSAGRQDRWMPAFGGALTDVQITALAAYLRREAADAAPWPDLAKAVAETRQGTGPGAGAGAGSGSGPGSNPASSKEAR